MQEFIDAIKERYRSPLIGNFIFAWLIWNWKIPYFTIFVNENTVSPYNKLDYIKILISEVDGKAWHFLIGPLLISLTISTAYPFIKGWIEYLKDILDNFFARKSEQLGFEYPLVSARNKYMESVLALGSIDIQNKIRSRQIMLADIFTGTWNIVIKPGYQIEENLIFKDGRFLKPNNEEFLFLSNMHNSNSNNSKQGPIGVDIKLANDKINSSGSLSFTNRSYIILHVHDLSGTSIELVQIEIREQYDWT